MAGASILAGVISVFDLDCRYCLFDSTPFSVARELGI